MNYAVKRAMVDWEVAVDAELVRLIEQGIPPFDAAGIARDNVSRKRRNSTTVTTTPEVKDEA